MKKFSVIIICALLIVSLFACSSDPLVGKWYNSDEMKQVMEAVGADSELLDEYAFEIKSNGTLVGNTGAVLDYEVDGDKLIIFDETGAATEPLYIDGDKLSLEDGTVLYVKK